jgi:molybdenum cofactor cytidylyltransferase
LHTLILAAGRGSRFGGDLKQLADIAGETMLQRAVGLAQAVTPERVSVVLGYEHEKLRLLVKSVHTFVNPNWQTGIGGSITFGVASLPASASAVLIYLCDQVALSEADLKCLCTAYEDEESRITCAAYAGGFGVPAIFPRVYFPQLVAIKGDSGAKQLLHANPVISIPLEAAAIDIDTYEQWVKFTANSV